MNYIELLAHAVTQVRAVFGFRFNLFALVIHMRTSCADSESMPAYIHAIKIQWMRRWFGKFVCVFIIFRVSKINFVGITWKCTKSSSFKIINHYNFFEPKNI